MVNGTIPDLAFLVDTKEENEGKWYRIGELPGVGTVQGLKRVKVRSEYVQDYQDAMNESRIQAIKDYEPGESRLKFLQDERLKNRVRYLLADWDMYDRDGEVVEFSSDLAYQLYTLEDENGMNPARKFVLAVDTAIAAIQGEVTLIVETDEGN